MKAWTITAFLISFYFALSLLNSTNLFATSTITPNVATQINQTYVLANTTIQETAGGLDTYGFLTTWRYLSIGWRTLGNFFNYALNIQSFLINELGVPDFIAITIQLIIYLIYLLTFIEIVTGRVFE